MRAGLCMTRVVLLVCMLAVDVLAQLPAELGSKLPDVPSKFNLDIEEAARLKPQLMAESVPASGRYGIGRLTMERLVRCAPHGTSLSWQLRIVEDGLLNAYSSADGTVYVESGLGQLAGSQAGLWAAILSHEVAHVERRDWARRYLYQKALERQNGGIALGKGAGNRDALQELRQTTGGTSPRTTVTFKMGAHQFDRSKQAWTIDVLDEAGAVLARTEVAPRH